MRAGQGGYTVGPMGLLALCSSAQQGNVEIWRSGFKFGCCHIASCVTTLVLSLLIWKAGITAFLLHIVHDW